MAKKTKSGTSVQKQKAYLHASPNNGFKASFLKRFYGFVAGPVPCSFNEFIIMATVFLLPLFFWPWTYTSFELPKITLFRTMLFVLVAGVILAWVTSRIKSALSRSTKLSLKNLPGKLLKVSSPATNFARIKLPLILLALMVISWMICTALSPAPAVGVFGYYPRFQGLYTFVCYIIFAALVFWGTENGGARAINREPPNAVRRTGIDRILSVIVASSFLVSLSAFLQSWGVAWLNYWDVSTFLGRFFGTMGHPDYLASFLVIVIPIQIERIFANKGRLLAVLALSFSLATLYFTLSRSAFLGLFLGLLFFLMIASKKLGLKKLFITSLLMPILLLTALFTVNMFRDSDFVSNNTLLSRMVLKDENLRSVQTRLVLWPATVRQILDSPFYGYGPDSYAISFPKFAPAELNTLENLGDYPDRAHNFLLDYAVQFGIPGLLVFLALIATVIFRALRLVFWQKTGWLTPLALLSALLGLLVANFFGFFVTVTWVYFWLILAVLLRLVTPGAATDLSCPPALSLNPLEHERAKLLHARAGGARGVGANKTIAKVARFLVTALSIAAASASLFAGAAMVITQDISLFAADLSYRSVAVGGSALSYPPALSLNSETAAARLAPQISFYQYREAVQLTESGNLTAAADALDRMGKITGYDGLYYLQKGKLAAKTATANAVSTTGASAGVSAATAADTNAVSTAGASSGASTATASDSDFSAYFQKAVTKMPSYAPAFLEYGEALYKRAGELSARQTGSDNRPGVSAEEARAAYSKAAEVLENYLSICPQYYLWKGDLGARTPEEQLRYRIFYKQNPDFNDVLPMLADAYAKSAQTPANAAKSEYYKNLTFY